MFNLFSFALIVAVDIVLKEELLSIALVMWGLALILRYIWNRRPAAYYAKSKERRPAWEYEII